MQDMSHGGSLIALRRVPAALWALAWASLAPRLPRRVEGDGVLASVLARLRPQLEAAGAEVYGGSLPAVRADPRQLERVFRALIGNAARHRGAEAPIIHVSARPAGREWLFSVRDNGSGIDPGDHHAVFSAFRGARELPACRRIVRRHGGRLWVESARGQGATFYFSLPATRRLWHLF
ncbi:MAG: ATP-binding protein [Betaproteobacteria bacterium]|nr:ATP-binding protein [Betaproteobacteria bacterium]